MRTMTPLTKDGIPSNTRVVVAIKTTHNEEVKRVVQDINRLILPQDNSQLTNRSKLQRKSFTFTFDGKDRNITCLYIKGTIPVIKYLFDQGSLVETNVNQDFLSRVKSNLNKFNYYFIRRRGKDDNWYLMLFIVEKNNED